MRNKNQSQPVENLYLQVWRNPIFYGELLADVGPEQWHTLTGLAVFMNNKGECNPSLSKLRQILGLNSIASVSRRIKSLESARFNGYPLIEVLRDQKKNIRGKWKYANNRYRINQQVIAIFATRDSVTAYSRLQTERGKGNKAESSLPLDTNEQRNDDNITRESS